MTELNNPNVKSKNKIDILGKGSYGCVLPKAIKCNKPFKTEFLYKPSKLFTNKDDFITEIKNTEFINKHDKGNTCITIFDYCILTKEIINNILNKYNVDRELLIKCSLQNNQELFQIIFNELGNDLEHLKNIPFNMLFLKAYNILKGISLFNKLHFLHLDIKHNNIIYYKKTNKLLIIDFGLSLSYKDFFNYENISLFTQNYTFNHPPEFIAYKYSSNKSSIFNDDFYKFKKAYENYLLFPNMLNFIIKYCYNNNYNDYNNALLSLFKLYYYSSNLNNTLKSTIDKIDIYGFGITFLYIIYNNKLKFSKYDKNIFKLLSLTLLIEPSKRISANKLMKLYENTKII